MKKSTSYPNVGRIIVHQAADSKTDPLGYLGLRSQLLEGFAQDFINPQVTKTDLVGRRARGKMPHTVPEQS
jgi:hypothetical protein